MDAGAWAALAVGGLAYAAVIGFVAALVARLCGLAGRFAPRASTRAGLGLWLAGLAVWGFLSLFREFTPTFEDGLVLGGLSGLVLAVRLAPVTGRCSSGAAWLFAGIVLAAGLAQWHVTGRYFLFDADRAFQMTVLPPAWMAAAFVTGVCCWWLRGWFGGVLRIAHAAFFLATPLLSDRMAGTEVPAGGQMQPNLVFIIADTLRADVLSLYGGPVAAPHLEALARDGIVFENCTSLAPWTPPSVTGMFASQYPPGLTPGVAPELWLDQLWRYDVPREQRTLAECLRDNGYATGALVANALLTSLQGLNEGFDAHAFSHPMLLRPQGFFAPLPFLQDALAACCPVLAPVRPQDSTSALLRYAGAFLNGNAGRPFFLWLHLMDPHAPYDPPARFRDRTGPWPFFHPFPGGERWGIPIVGRAFNVADADKPYVRSLFEGEVRYADETVGRVMETLNVLGVNERTLVVFLSDHGEELWEHGDWGHGQSLYQELIHVPLIMRVPGVSPGRVAEPVSSLDLMPTLAEFMGTTPEPTWRGENLAPVLRGETQLDPLRPVFALGTSNKAYPEPLQMVRRGPFKLVREGGTAKGRLFNLSEDPGETRDAAAGDPAAMAELNTLIEAWLGTFQSAFSAEVTPDEAARRHEMQQRLDAMGYLP